MSPLLKLIPPPFPSLVCSFLSEVGSVLSVLAGGGGGGEGVNFPFLQGEAPRLRGEATE
jgi:hypothetical protein